MTLKKESVKGIVLRKMSFSRGTQKEKFNERSGADKCQNSTVHMKCALYSKSSEVMRLLCVRNLKILLDSHGHHSLSLYSCYKYARMK